MEMQGQICQTCGYQNGISKKYCARCRSVLDGFTTNNITGEWGYRHADGTFSPQTRTEFEGISHKKANLYIERYHSLKISSDQAIIRAAYLRGFEDCIKLSKEN